MTLPILSLRKLHRLAQADAALLTLTGFRITSILVSRFLLDLRLVYKTDFQDPTEPSGVILSTVYFQTQTEGTEERGLDTLGAPLSSYSHLQYSDTSDYGDSNSPLID